MMPGFGLEKGRFNFFMRPDQPMQFVAVKDIGRIVAVILPTSTLWWLSPGDRQRRGDRPRSGGPVYPGGRPADPLLPLLWQRAGVQSFLAKLTELVDDGRLMSNANLEELPKLGPELMSFRSWLTASYGQA